MHSDLFVFVTDHAVNWDRSNHRRIIKKNKDSIGAGAPTLEVLMGRRCSAQRGSGGQNFSMVSMNHLFYSAADDAARRSPFVGPAMVLKCRRRRVVCVCTPTCVLMRRGAEAGLVGAGAVPPSSPPPPPLPDTHTFPSPLLLAPSLQMQWFVCNGAGGVVPKRKKKKKKPSTANRRPIGGVRGSAHRFGI